MERDEFEFPGALVDEESACRRTSYALAANFFRSSPEVRRRRSKSCGQTADPNLRNNDGDHQTAILEILSEASLD
jgi:hypothetical protein